MKRGRCKNSDVRPREHLLPAEVERLLKAASKTGDYAHRDYTMILLAYRHGFRASELCALRWSHVDLAEGWLHCSRLKGSNSNAQPLSKVEAAALRKIKPLAGSPYVFNGDQAGPLNRNTFWRIVARAGEAAGLPFPVHPHMLRHSCGYMLANAGVDTRLIQDVLGHKAIQHTVRYTATNPRRFLDAAKLFDK